MAQQGNVKKRKARGSPISVKYPLQFHVKDQWHYLNIVEPSMPCSVEDPGLIARLIAYKCINFRGAIAHCKRTELIFGSQQISEPSFAEEKSVKDVFDAEGGTKVLADIDAIKEELMNNGPVVSTSFHLCSAFLNACEHSSSFAVSQVDQTHPLVIVGWKLSAFGEMWLTRSIDGSANDIPISFGQFSIDDECLAPLNSFEKTPWQDKTKAFGVYFSADQNWYSWSKVEIYLTNSELSNLAQVLGHGFAAAVNGKTRFVLRNKDKIAHSRWAYITEIAWSDDKKMWKMDATFVA